MKFRKQFCVADVICRISFFPAKIEVAKSMIKKEGTWACYYTLKFVLGTYEME